MSVDILNSSQRLIVCDKKEGVSIVSAGPGSGKTRVLAHRIMHLLEDLPHQASVVALTFSNKAQHEMRNRIDELNPGNLQAVKIHTFHSFCSRILRTYGQEKLGELVNNAAFGHNFSIFDQTESLRIIKTIIKRNQLPKLKEEDIYNQIMKSKENIVLNWTSQMNEFSLKSSSMDRLLYDLYEKDLRDSNAADFSDLLILTWRLLRQYPEIRTNLQRDYRHILIDEYQDTNLLQDQITKLLYLPPSRESLPFSSDIATIPRSLFVVGDPNQSIYSWRGALPGNIKNLTQDFTNSVQHELKINYRSSPNILAVANAILGSVSTTPSLDKLDANTHLPVYIYAAKTDINQAEFICRTLKSMTGKSRAILYRTNVQSYALEMALMQADVKYKIRGGKKYIDRKEVQDLLAYLRLLVNPRNISALKRSINTPSRGIGEKSQAALFKWIDRYNSECVSKNHLPPTLLDYLYAINILTEEKGSDDVNTTDQDEISMNHPESRDDCIQESAVHDHVGKGDDNDDNDDNDEKVNDSDGDSDGDDDDDEEEEDYTLDESLHKTLAHSCPLSQREKRALSKYASLIIKLHQHSRKIPLTELIEMLITSVDYRGYITHLSNNDSDNEADRWQNIVEIMKTGERFSEKRNKVNVGSSLGDFIEYYDCFQTSSEVNESSDSEEVEDIVELMTIHASKGLEFDVVVLCGVEEGVLPLTHEGNSEEEEKRLAYVAITRAKSMLIITYRETLNKIRANGSHYRMKTTPSRFLKSLKSLPTATCIWVNQPTQIAN